MSFLARGALRSKKRFAGGVLDPAHFVELIYRRPRTEGGMLQLQEAHMINDFQKISRSYDAITLALHAVECVSKVSQEGDVNNDALFKLLGNMLKAVEIREDFHFLRTQFHLKFLWQQGVLTLEPWMKTYLALPLLQMPEKHRNQEQAQAEQGEWVEFRVAEYLASAEASGFEFRSRL